MKLKTLTVSLLLQSTLTIAQPLSTNHDDSQTVIALENKKSSACWERKEVITDYGTWMIYANRDSEPAHDQDIVFAEFYDGKTQERTLSFVANERIAVKGMVSYEIHDFDYYLGENIKEEIRKIKILDNVYECSDQFVVLEDSDKLVFCYKHLMQVFFAGFAKEMRAHNNEHTSFHPVLKHEPTYPLFRSIPLSLQTISTQKDIYLDEYPIYTRQRESDGNTDKVSQVMPVERIEIEGTKRIFRNKNFNCSQTKSDELQRKYGASH